MIDVKQHLSPHFQLFEFLHGGATTGLTQTIIANLTRLAAELEKIRADLGGLPMIITSGFRTPTHNAAVGGADGSYHQQGLAADFVIRGQSPRLVQRAIDPWWPGGLEYCADHTHADLGPRRRFQG